MRFSNSLIACSFVASALADNFVVLLDYDVDLREFVDGIEDDINVVDEFPFFNMVTVDTDETGAAALRDHPGVLAVELEQPYSIGLPEASPAPSSTIPTEPESEPTTELVPQTTSEPEAEPTSELESQTTTKPAGEPTSGFESQTTAVVSESESTTTQPASQITTVPEPEPTTEPEPQTTTETEAEPISDTESDSDDEE
ncbi:hypothetical protein LX36DRAFT_232739 [Colletotrichum falcatum]|nr:hypothetical protein LX36DRAFT_232739 [Colletotrichum falcatum]